jgi:hypothetical protein
MDDKSRDRVSIGYKTLHTMDPTKNQMIPKDNHFLIHIRHPPNAQYMLFHKLNVGSSTAHYVRELKLQS